MSDWSAYVCSSDLAEQQLAQTAVDGALDDRLLVVAVLGPTLDLGPLDGQGALVLLDAMAGADATFHDGAGDTRRHPHRAVAPLRSLFAADGAPPLLSQRHRAFPLRHALFTPNFPP